MVNDEICGIAFERAWSAYRLINNVDERSERYATLDRFIRARCAEGVTDANDLAVAALIHLKQLDSTGAE